MIEKLTGKEIKDSIKEYFYFIIRLPKEINLKEKSKEYYYQRITKVILDLKNLGLINKLSDIELMNNKLNEIIDEKEYETMKIDGFLLIREID